MKTRDYIWGLASSGPALPRSVTNRREPSSNVLMKSQTSVNPRPVSQRVLLCGAILAYACSAVCGAPAAKAGGSTGVDTNLSQLRQPVLVELFTSEGCSSCPPADALLARLDATRFVAGAQAIVLSEHVTYWNYLGWSDPFSLEEMSQRQTRYGSRFGLDSVYTPQAVVDGTAQVLASDATAMSHAIAGAAKKPKPELRIEGAHWNGSTIGFAVKAPESVHGVLTVALAEDATHSIVGRGENAGRTLHHVAVVRVMKTLGRDKADEQPLVLEVGSGSSVTGHTFRLVAFITDEQEGRVLAVAEIPITRP